jgi:diacylglycerol kinase (ATP)
MPIKPLLIYNPAAGKGGAGKKLLQVQALLQERQFEYDLVLTEGVGHAQVLALQAAEEGRALVIAAGGDGTMNEVINGLMAYSPTSSRPALGVLPVGRGNDFSFGVGIPQEISAACDNLLQAKRLRIDIGRVSGGDYPEGRYFGNGVGLGFDTVVGFEPAKLTRLHGAASYLVAVIRTIFLYAHAPTYEVTYDGATVRQPFLMVSVMNGRRMGGSFMMAPTGNPADGLFNLCLAGQVSQIKILPLAATFISGKQEGNPAIKMPQAKSVSITAIQGAIPAHADGETICTAGSSLKIDLHPAALDVITQADGRQA